MRLTQPTPGAQGVYEDAGTVDPHALNEALTATRPSDIEAQDTEAYYKQAGQAELGADAVTGVAEHSFSDPIGSTPSGAVGAGVSGPQVAASGTPPQVPADHLAANPALRAEGGPDPV